MDSRTIDCKARQYADEMHCGRCGLVWDINDPDPPQCRTDSAIHREQGRRALDKIKRELEG